MTEDAAGDAGVERPECTNMECSGEAEFAYWMPGLGHFSEARDPDGQLDDGDLSPYVCESCRDRMVSSPHWDADRFVRPEERLVADGGNVACCPVCGKECNPQILPDHIGTHGGEAGVE